MFRSNVCRQHVERRSIREAIAAWISVNTGCKKFAFLEENRKNFSVALIPSNNSCRIGNLGRQKGLNGQTNFLYPDMISHEPGGGPKESVSSGWVQPYRTDYRSFHGLFPWDDDI